MLAQLRLPGGAVTGSLPLRVVDWSLFHFLNGALRHNDGGQDAAQIFNGWAIFVLVGLAGAIWFLARPDGSQRSKLAALSAAASAALALLLNVVLAQFSVPRPSVRRSPASDASASPARC